MASRLLVAHIVRLGAVRPASKEDDVVTLAQHDVPGQKLALADLMRHLRQGVCGVAIRQPKAVRDVATAVTPERATVRARATALGWTVALAVWDLLIGPVLSARDDLVAIRRWARRARRGWCIARANIHQAVVVASTLVVRNLAALTTATSSRSANLGNVSTCATRLSKSAHAVCRAWAQAFIEGLALVRRAGRGWCIARADVHQAVIAASTLVVRNESALTTATSSRRAHFGNVSTCATRLSKSAHTIRRAWAQAFIEGLALSFGH